MQYTTQQLQGGPKYSHKTRVGNWNEDFELQTIKQADYDTKKNAKALPFDKTIATFEEQSKRVPWSYFDDGILRSGMSVMMKNKKTNGWLCMDIGERQLGVDGDAFNLTTCKVNPGPISRSVFVIKRAEKVDIFGTDDVVRYGQKIKIEANPYIYRKTLFVSSTPLGPQCFSPESRKQELSVHSNEHFVGTWIIDSIDPNFRFERQGEPVALGDPILFRHPATGNYMASDDKRHGTDFGGEFECMCYSFAIQNKTQNLALEQKGLATSDVPSRFQHDQNVFFAVSAPDPSYAQEIADLQKYSIEDLVADIKARLLDRSASGIKGISRIFKAMDDNGNHQLDLDDFRWGFIDYGFNLSKEEAQELFKRFDRDQSGTIDFDEFLRFLKGDLNEFRVGLIRAAYDKLDVNKDGLVKFDDVVQIYDASQHFDVIIGKKIFEDVFCEFMIQWDCQEADGIVIFDEFCDYFFGVSCSIDRDDYFELMMKNFWKI